MEFLMQLVARLLGASGSHFCHFWPDNFCLHQWTNANRFELSWDGRAQMRAQSFSSCPSLIRCFFHSCSSRRVPLILAGPHVHTGKAGLYYQCILTQCTKQCWPVGSYRQCVQSWPSSHQAFAQVLQLQQSRQKCVPSCCSHLQRNFLSIKYHWSSRTVGW